MRWLTSSPLIGFLMPVRSFIDPTSAEFSSNAACSNFENISWPIIRDCGRMSYNFVYNRSLPTCTQLGFLLHAIVIQWYATVKGPNMATTTKYRLGSVISILLLIVHVWNKLYLIFELFFQTTIYYYIQYSFGFLFSLSHTQLSTA